MAKIPKLCPSCASQLEIIRLSCPRCGTEVTGHFEPDFFSRLSPNDFDFVVLFIQSKGNIKEMERILGISYWTIRSKLNEIVAGLAGSSTGQAPAAEGVQMYGEAAPDSGAARQQILEQLNAGLISVDEAAAKLEELKKER